MIAVKCFAFLLVTCSWCHLTQATDLCREVWNLNRTFEFSLFSRKNQTGHLVTKFSLENTSERLPRNWKIDITHSTTFVGGKEIFHLQGKLTVPPALPADYQLFPGIGYYKYYPERAVTFDEAYAACEADGGHLAIINSEAEHNVVRSFVKQYSAYLGFHDRIKEGEFVTIFGEPLGSTGFQGWLQNQPDNAGGKENCGSYHPGGGLNDVPCDSRMTFICEYDLSWTE